MARRRMTSQDVARRVGVSQTTVSLVFNDARSNIRISDATRQRVLAAAKELGYAPHRAARALRRRRSGVIGFIPRHTHAVPFEHPVGALLGFYLAQAAAATGYQVVEPRRTAAGWRGDAELGEFLIDHQVDGAIFDSSGSDRGIRQALDLELPIVQLFEARPEVTVSTVVVDATPGIRDAVDHLVREGHRRIAFLGSGRERRDAFVAALARHRLTVPDGYLQLGPEYALEVGHALTRVVLALPPTRRPTALFAASDSIALGVLRALYEARMRVPDVMSLVSYDDTLASRLSPPLTSVAQPFEAIAERAVALLVTRLDTPDGPITTPTHIALPTGFIVRQSTAPPPLAARISAASGSPPADPAGGKEERPVT